ncbi:MAG: ABC transporter substrate-binding protein [Proteobacteria bacterium]|jgi:branched-chain amino acid transport system substrate-binding protein|nr:ABC transporter substrate-binding protein [Pseudomonadota bacterium]MDA1300554.1 ABC transporter substrate-binding protein [Pseudomonadota bacterium]
MKTTRWFTPFSTALMAGLLLILTACGGNEKAPTAATPATTVDPGQAPATPGVTDDEIVLGSHTDLSGSIAIWGVGSINGARMRFDDANDAGGIQGRKIRFVVEDTQYKVPRAIQAANKLINRDHIFAMVLALGTPTNNAVLTQQLRAGVPNMFPLTGARAMAEPYSDLKFTQRGIYYDEIRAGVRYFAEEMGKEKPCVIYQDSDYGQEILEGATDQLAAMGSKLVGTSAHKPDEIEFTSSIIRLRDAGCDVVYMGTVHRDTILVLEAARKMGFGATFVGNNAAYGQVIADQTSGSGEGYHAFVHMAKIYKDDDLPDAVTTWWQDYESRFGAEPGIPAMEGYRAADLIVLALTRAGRDLTRESFIRAMESIDDYQDIFGYRIVFGPGDHKGVDESVLSVVENGRWKTLATTIGY